MAADTPRPRSAPTARALIKVVVYYVVLFVIGLFVWDSVAEYAVQIKKTTPEDLLTLVRTASAPHVAEAELV